MMFGCWCIWLMMHVTLIVQTDSFRSRVIHWIIYRNAINSIIYSTNPEKNKQIWNRNIHLKSWVDCENTCILVIWSVFDEMICKHSSENDLNYRNVEFLFDFILTLCEITNRENCLASAYSSQKNLLHLIERITPSRWWIHLFYKYFC